MKHSNSLPTAMRGFTLIELMVVVAILAIISAIAVPSYDGYMVRGRRAEAKTIVMRAALWMERNQTASFSYAADASGVTLTANTLLNIGLGRSPENGNTIWYDLILREPVAPAAFLIIATARGTQATRDANCSILIMDHLGRRGRLNGSAQDFNSVIARDCWAQ